MVREPRRRPRRRGGLAHGIVGWFCNLPLLAFTVRMLTGRTPALRSAALNLAVAATTFLPYELFLDQIGGETYPMVRGPGFYLWFAAMTVPVLVALAGRRAEKATVGPQGREASPGDSPKSKSTVPPPPDREA
jgi:hypothetical protein